MRGATLARFVVAAAACVVAAPEAPAEDEWERPFHGVLPRPEPRVSVNPPEVGAEPGPRVAAFVLDGATGRPVPGARLTLWPERAGTEVVSYAEIVARGACDARGVAVVDTTGWEGGNAHWVADAPGYAPETVWGERPPTRMLLRRGVEVRGRVLDPFGAPVADALVDIFPGCSHSGRVREARTTKDGTFTLRDVVPNGDLHGCVHASAGLCRFEEGFGTLGRRPVDLALRTSIVVRGRFVDDEKRPVAGVTVRGTEFRRWPVAVSDADGRFELPGFERTDSCIFIGPGSDVDHDYVGERIHADDVVHVIRIDGDSGEPARAADDAAVEVRPRLADGKRAPPLDLLLVRPDDGHEETCSTDDDDEVAVLDALPSGDYEIRPLTPFQPATFAPARVRLAPNARTSAEVVVEPQPRLRVEGALPVAASVTLVVPGHEIEWDDDEALGAWSPHLPAAAVACLRVEPEGQRVAFFVPVGPEKDGVRVAKVEVPEPHRIVVHAPAALDDADLRCDGLDVAWTSDGAAGWTYARGPMQLVARIDDDVRRFEFDLGDAPRAVVLDWEKALPAAAPGKVLVTVEDAQDDDVSVSVQGHGWSITNTTRVESVPPCRVVATRKGHQPLDRTFSEPATVHHVWGPCTLRLTVQSVDGARLASVVAVDGVLHWTRDGVLELAGLGEGPHEVLVDPVDPSLAGAELRLVLAGPAARERTVVVGR
jgi:hypothetical protein